MIVIQRRLLWWGESGVILGVDFASSKTFVLSWWGWGLNVGNDLGVAFDCWGMTLVFVGVNFG